MANLPPPGQLNNASKFIRNRHRKAHSGLSLKGWISAVIDGTLSASSGTLSAAGRWFENKKN